MRDRDDRCVRGGPRGRGTLIDSVKGLGHERLWLITTNDNSRAQRFYERVGFRLVGVHQGAVERSRELKPEIPLVSADGTPIRDELEYEFRPRVRRPSERLALPGARSSRDELVAGILAADHPANEAAPAVRERRPHGLAVATPNARARRRTVVRLRLRQSPDLGHAAS
jgi:hypothetical protein